MTYATRFGPVLAGLLFQTFLFAVEPAVERSGQVPAVTVELEDPIGAGTVISEQVVERYDDSSIKIQRSVLRDKQRSYVNHGPWSWFSQDGRVIAEGSYARDKRHGLWIRQYRGDESELFAHSPYGEYGGPFISVARFTHGTLDGTWVIMDRKKNRISEVDYANGRRHGTAIWWYVDGTKMREVQFRNGRLDGRLRHWNEDGELVLDESFEMGRRRTSTVAHYASGGKQSEINFLEPERSLTTSDDWWNATMAGFVKEGEPVRHGPWLTWHENGNRKMEGVNCDGQPCGLFTWWYANGQKQTEGGYEAGRHQGVWTWWNEGGQKILEGEFKAGREAGRWTWWDEDGEIKHMLNLDDPDVSQPLVDDTPADPGSFEVKQITDFVR